MTARQRQRTGRIRAGSDSRRHPLRFESLEARMLFAAAPFGAEFRVNTYTTDSQFAPAVARDSEGDFVVVWASEEQDAAPGWGIYAQRYASDGTELGAEFRVNTYTTEIQFAPTVAMDADGDFVIAWQSKGQDGADYGIYAQRYNSGGTALGLEFRVNTVTTDAQTSPSVAMDADGDFVIAWSSNAQDGASWGVYAQRYNASGVAQGGAFKVNTQTSNAQRAPAVAMDATGRFVVVWRSNLQDGSGYGIYAQRYNAAGTAQGAEFRVNTYTTNHQFAADVAMDADGDFVVVWDSYNQDLSNNGIYAKRYNVSGVVQGSEFRVNSFTPGLQFAPSVSMDAGGDFVVAWTSYYQDGSDGGVYAQRYNATGAAVDDEFRVNTETGGGQNSAAVAMDADDGFVVAWNSNGQDFSAGGIYAKRLGNAVLGDIDGDFDVDADDIDALCELIHTSDPSGDLDGNSVTNQNDMDYMINTVLGTTYGDADLDGDVDGADFDAWRLRNSLGDPIGWATGDWDCDGDVDGGDFDLWRLRPTTIPGGEAEAAPQSIALTGSPAAAPAQLAEPPSSEGETRALIAAVQVDQQSAASAEKTQLSPTTDTRDTSLYRSRHLRRSLGLPAGEALEHVFAAWGLPR